MAVKDAIKQEFNRAELEVLQRHLDLYRSLPEVSSPHCFSIRYDPGSSEAITCSRLADKGLMTVETREGEWENMVTYEGSELFASLESSGKPVHRSDGHLYIYYQKNVIPPAVQGQLTPKGTETLVKLFQAGILKKND